MARQWMERGGVEVDVGDSVREGVAMTLRDEAQELSDDVMGITLPLKI